MLEPLGQSQVFKYLRRLAKSHDIILLSYEKKDEWRDASQRSALRAALGEAGIRWVPLRYHRRPSSLATSYDLAAGFLVSVALTLFCRVRIVHARSYVPSVLALGLKKLFGTRFIFDMRGFWADERVERAGWSKSAGIYRVAKWFERRFFTEADVVVSLTHAGVGSIRKLPYLQGRLPDCRVIPTCTDLERFKPPADRSGAPFTLGYVGSADSAYLFEPVLRCFRELRLLRPDARLLVVTRTPHAALRELLATFGIDGGCIEIKSVPHDAVAGEMGRMDAGIFFVKPGFSATASVPTKLGEFLACGVPCLGNAGIGDLESILEGESVGVILREFTREAERTAIAELVGLCATPGIGRRCREVAERVFSLKQGVAAYDRIYRSLSQPLGEGRGEGVEKDLPE